jgi:hypothetical protein
MERIGGGLGEDLIFPQPSPSHPVTRYSREHERATTVTAIPDTLSDPAISASDKTGPRDEATTAGTGNPDFHADHCAQPQTNASQ